MWWKTSAKACHSVGDTVYGNTIAGCSCLYCGLQCCEVAMVDAWRIGRGRTTNVPVRWRQEGTLVTVKDTA